MASLRRRTLLPALVVVLLLLLGGVAIVDGRAVVEKIVLRLLTPVGLIWIGLLLLALGALRRRQTGPAAGALLLWIVLTAAGNGPIVNQLYSRMEHEFVALDPFAAPRYDALIVLGGGSRSGANGRAQLNVSGDRIVLAAQLYHAGRTDRLICIGGRIRALQPDETDPARQAREILERLGIPAHAITESRGTITTEELQTIARNNLAVGRVGVITSAWHMPRVLRLARRHGLNLEPVPADFVSVPDRNAEPLTFGAAVYHCLPNAEALEAAARLGKEYLARLVGR